MYVTKIDIATINELEAIAHRNAEGEQNDIHLLGLYKRAILIRKKLEKRRFLQEYRMESAKAKRVLKAKLSKNT